MRQPDLNRFKEVLGTVNPKVVKEIIIVERTQNIMTVTLRKTEITIGYSTYLIFDTPAIDIVAMVSETGVPFKIIVEPICTECQS